MTTTMTHDELTAIFGAAQTTIVAARVDREMGVEMRVQIRGEDLSIDLIYHATAIIDSTRYRLEQVSIDSWDFDGATCLDVTNNEAVETLDILLDCCAFPISDLDENVVYHGQETKNGGLWKFGYGAHTKSGFVERLLSSRKEWSYRVYAESVEDDGSYKAAVFITMSSYGFDASMRALVWYNAKGLCHQVLAYEFGGCSIDDVVDDDLCGDAMHDYAPLMCHTVAPIADEIFDGIGLRLNDLPGDGSPESFYN